MLDPAFWSDFFERTGEMRSPCVWPGQFSGRPASDEGELADILRDARSGLEAGLHMRVFIERAERGEGLERVLRDPPRVGEGLESWSRRLFDGRRFGVVLSNAETVSEPLARRCAHWLAPFLARRGFRFPGVTLSFFIGNYGMTPFGIHHDSHMHLFHGHVGPGTKTMYLWDPDTYKEKWGSAHFCHEPQRMLEHAEALTIEPDTFLYFPGRYYHIGDTPEFSTAVVIVLSDLFKKDLLAQAIARCPIEPDARAAVAPLRLRGNAVTTGLAAADEHTPVDDWLRVAITTLRLRCLSTGAPPRTPRRIAVAEASLRGARLAAVAPFRMLTPDLGDGRMVVFVRGRSLLAPAHPAVRALIEQLNTGAPLSVDEALVRLTTAYSDGEALSFLAELVRDQAVEVVAEEHRS